MPSPFEAFPLHPAVLAGLETLDVGAPTAVQTHVIPLLMEGQDVVVHAGPHSGETLAYGLPLLSLFDPMGKAQAIVVVPSAERAIRVYKRLAPLAQGVLKVAPLYEAGGAQEQLVKRGVDIIIGTPFLIKDLFAIKQLDLSNVRMIVLDGADRMMTTVQRRDVEYLLDRLPMLEQTALFTWNVTEGVEAIAHHLKNPAMVRLTPSEPAEAAPEPVPAPVTKPPARRPSRAKAGTAPLDAADEVAIAKTPAPKAAAARKPKVAEAHRYARVASDQRAEFLLGVLEQEAPARALVLARNKHEARRLTQKLEKLGRNAVDAINADTSAAARNAVLARFRAGDLRFLVVPENATKELDLGAPEHLYLTGVAMEPELYKRYAEAASQAGGALRSLSLVTPEAEQVFEGLKAHLKFERHPQDQGPEEPEPAPAPVAAAVEAVAAPMPKMLDGGRGRTGRPMVVSGKPQRDAATLINESQRELKATTGPLAPLPRMHQTWQTFKVTITPGQRPSRDSFHGWLSQASGIPRSSLRSIQLHKGYATVDVEERQVERFHARMKDLLLG